MLKRISKKQYLYGFLVLIILTYLVLKAIKTGNDINVYLFAAESFLKGDNIYTNNPYNFYLYSPLFAFLLSPLTHLPWAIARIIWLLLNVACLIRVFNICRDFATKHLALKGKYYKWWLAIILILSFGFVNHNVNLGQITILILWLTVEAMVLADKKMYVKAGLLLALGISFKIIPAIVLGYWFLQGKFKAISASLIFVGVTFILPSFYTSWQKNIDLHQTWAKTINPDREKYAFENNNGCQSLNAILPAYFYTFSEDDKATLYGLNRKIADIDYTPLKNVLQILRIFFLLSVAVIVFYKAAHRREKWLYRWWQMAYLLLVTLLVFPHQMKYSMLYFVPVAAYIVYYFLSLLQANVKLDTTHKTIGILSALLIFILSIMGRDIIGSYLVNLLDFYHFMGLSNIIFVGIYYYCTPYRLNTLLSGKTKTSIQSSNL